MEPLAGGHTGHVTPAETTFSRRDNRKTYSLGNEKIEIIFPNLKNALRRPSKRGRGPPKINCGPHKVANRKGVCVEPIVTNSLFVFGTPPRAAYNGHPIAPKPKISHNVIFVYTPNKLRQKEPIVIAPPQQKTIVYVLTKSPHAAPKVIQTPAYPKERPEVFYVNYDEKDNPLLAGVPLQEVLALKDKRGGLSVREHDAEGTRLEPVYVEGARNTSKGISPNTERDANELSLFFDAKQDVEKKNPLFINVNRQAKID